MFSIQKEWLMSHRQNIILLVGLVFVGLLSFEGGLLRGKTSQSAPMIISLPASIEPAVEETVASGDTEGQTSTEGTISKKQTVADCPLVGSRNSDKYHLSTCAVVKRIKTENRVCFSSKEDAEKRGYTAGCTK